MNPICTQTLRTMKLLTSPHELSTYKQFITKTTAHFIINHKQMLHKIFTIKNKKVSVDNISITISSLDNVDNTLKIPPFIDIIKYLFANMTVKHFTQQELDTFHNVLRTYSNEGIYNYLCDNVDFVVKIIKVYYEMYHTLEIVFPSVKFHQLLLNNFTSFKILEAIETTLSQLSIISLDRISNPILYIYSDNTTSTKYIKHLANQIINRMFFFNTFLGNDKLPRKIVVFLTHQEKVIDKQLELDRHFRTLHVNTAVTNGEDIIIYRKQEVLKSVFHELIHFHRLDFHDKTPGNVLDYLKRTHNILDKNEYLLYECITEVLANILNNMYSSGTVNIVSFQKNLVNEIIFSTFQISKILKLGKYKTWEEFVLLERNTHNVLKQFRQDSCVFSYYVLKLYLLLNLDEYWKYILDEQLKFRPTPDNFNKLINIFEKGRKNKHLSRIINTLLHNYNYSRKTNNKRRYKSTKKSTKYSKNKTTIHNTLRMTCVE